MGVTPDLPGVECWLSVDVVRSMLTALRSFRGVAYVFWPFCALSLFDVAGEEVIWSLGVIGRSCCDDTVEDLGRFAGDGCAESSSARGRFSVTLIAGTGAFVAVADDSGRRAATLGMGFAFLSTLSGALLSDVDLCGCSSRSFLAPGPSLFGGRASSLLMVSRDFFVYLSLTMRVGSWSSLLSTTSLLGDFPFNDIDRARETFWVASLSFVLTGFFDAVRSGTCKLWLLLRSDEEVEVFESARFRWMSILSSSARMVGGSVGERMVGRPCGLLNGGSTGDKSGGKP